MVIPLVGRLNPASGKEGLLPECCRGNLYAKQTGQKTFQEDKSKYWLVWFENTADAPHHPTTPTPLLFGGKWLLWSTVMIYLGQLMTPVSEGCGWPAADPVTLSWDAGRDLSRKFLFRGLLLLCCPASTVNPRLNISVLFFVYPKLKRNRGHSLWSPKARLKGKTHLLHALSLVCPDLAPSILRWNYLCFQRVYCFQLTYLVT